MIDIVAALRAERSRLQGRVECIDEALGVLQGLSGKSVSDKRTRKARRSMSASARRRIAQAQRARWAKWRKEQKG
jgi:hypothetical protein